MAISDDVLVTVLLADYVGVDASGKVNAIGAGFGVAGLSPNGLTAPQHVAVLVDVPGGYAGEETSVTLELRNDRTGQVVSLPSPSGQAEAVRISQLMQIQAPERPGVYLPRDVRVRQHLLVNFGNGLPLSPGTSYQWRVDVDGVHRQDWGAFFYVLGPPPGPVIGGPAGASDIPGVAGP